MVIIGKIQLNPGIVVNLHKQSTIVSVSPDVTGAIFAYAVMNLDKPKTDKYKFWIVGTGWDLKQYDVAEDATFLGTVTTNNFFKWHIFYKKVE